MLTVLKQDGKGSTRNHQETKGEKGENTTHRLNRRVLQILSWNHQNLKVILTHRYTHPLMQAHQVMIGEGRERNPPKEINTNVEKERTGDVTKNGGVVTRNLSVDQEGCVPTIHPSFLIALLCTFYLYFINA